jgi:NADPH:quinone reductase-like Zn-dependent oxidoreductase
MTFVTAWHMLVTRARLQRGDDVLILAAGSGVGQAAIQIAVLFGARVIATAGSEEKMERARALGAAEVIHHHKQDIADEIKRLTNKRGVDVVIEHVGEATWAKSVRSLARGGRLVTCGATTGSRGSLDLAALFSKQLSILGSYMGTKGELLEAARLFFAGRLAPAVDRTFPLSGAAAAQRRLEESGQFGKIVLEV